VQRVSSMKPGSGWRVLALMRAGRDRSRREREMCIVRFFVGRLRFFEAFPPKLPEPGIVGVVAEVGEAGELN
jgi:hypothetical protein